MLVRHQADATTQAHIGQASGMPGGRRASQERLTRFDALRYLESGVPGMEGVRPPDAPDEAGAPRSARPRDGADGRQSFHLTRLVYTCYCHNGGLW